MITPKSDQGVAPQLPSSAVSSVVNNRGTVPPPPTSPHASKVCCLRGIAIFGEENLRFRCQVDPKHHACSTVSVRSRTVTSERVVVAQDWTEERTKIMCSLELWTQSALLSEKVESFQKKTPFFFSWRRQKRRDWSAIATDYHIDCVITLQMITPISDQGVAPQLPSSAATSVVNIRGTEPPLPTFPHAPKVCGLWAISIFGEENLRFRSQVYPKHHAWTTVSVRSRTVTSERVVVAQDWNMEWTKIMRSIVFWT